ncbi:hypothetical protein L1889_10350 [Paenalcaligenes niemegkensis]|uniref:hypothetical protein n=1 Tax=Paenalcaligenes niemegkensis TaxID=2895469 RepID=UPI001EE86BAD|nr:hypothetical protein [Paenalcaligenes niemegkensis]MCQ9617054.1 hypothetical protein [Paenalcaligenes niemegkensis]
MIRSGAILQSPEVFLITAERSGGGISIEAGGGINTLGQGAVAFDSLDGYVYRTNEMDVLAVSNGWLDMQAPAAPTTAPVGKIDIGACTLSIDCIRSAELYSEGTIAIATNKQIELAESARYGTRNLSLAVGGVNIGTQEVLAAAQLRGVLPTGLTLNQDVLNRLLQGDQQYGAPALESLILTARNGLNFFETATLSTLGADGVSSLQNLVLNTPAIFGYGAADDVALIQTGNLIWNGTDVAPPAPLVTGPGTGSGIFKVQADTIEFGYADRTQPDPLVEHDRLMLGFAQVDLTARERVTSNHTGSLSVYQSRDEHVVGEGFAYQGGNLSIHSPLISSEAAAILAITAGGDVVLDGGLTGAQRPGSDVLGGTLAITGRNLFVDTAMVLPSGSLSLTAQDDLQLGDLAYLDVSGRTVPMFDQTQYSWGGEVSLDSLGVALFSRQAQRLTSRLRIMLQAA